MFIKGGTMRNRSNSLLRIHVIPVLLIAGFLTVPELSSMVPAQTAIIQVEPQVNAPSLAARYNVAILDSIPELNEYLVSGSAANLQSMSGNANVVSLEYDVLAAISEAATLNESTVALLDPDTVALLNPSMAALLDGQGGLWNSQQPARSAILIQPDLEQIHLNPVNAQTGNPVTVAVIDTGVDPYHAMLVGSTLPGQNFINGSLSTDELLDLDTATAALLLQVAGRSGLNEALVSVNPATVAALEPQLVSMLSGTPYFGHGTLVSGLIHAIAPTASILPLKAFGASGVGTSFSIAKAIVYAANQGASVINMSFNLDSYSALIGQAVSYAVNRNILLVASLGNNNSNLSQSYPASYPKVIGVAATDLNNLKASFSNYGSAAAISAPGVALISSYPASLYAAWSGTSAAAALVSGEAAFLLSQQPLTADQAASRIEANSYHLNDPPYQLGKGRIDLSSVLVGNYPFSQPASMEGNLTIAPGDWISGGYSFKLDNTTHTATNLTVTSRVSLAVTCPSGGGTGGSILVDLGSQTYSVNAGNTNWLPTGDANSVLSWMGSIQAPDLCNGHPMNNAQGALFTAVLSQSPPTGSLVDFRFKYDDPNAKGNGNVDCLNTSDPRRNSPSVCGAGWSPTATYP